MKPRFKGGRIEEPVVELIRWIDSSSVSDGHWTSIESIVEETESIAHTEMYHETVGWVIYEDETALIAASSLQDRHPKLHRMTDGTIKIPHVAIIERTQLGRQ